MAPPFQSFPLQHLFSFQFVSSILFISMKEFIHSFIQFPSFLVFIYLFLFFVYLHIFLHVLICLKQSSRTFCHLNVLFFAVLCTFFIISFSFIVFLLISYYICMCVCILVVVCIYVFVYVFHIFCAFF